MKVERLDRLMNLGEELLINRMGLDLIAQIVKPLTRHVRDSRYFSGCTIIGSGEVVLILDTGHLILSKRTDPHARACA